MRVALAEDGLLFREGLARLLGEAGFEVGARCASGEELMRAIADRPPDVAILDVRMPPTHTDEGLRAAEEIRARHRGVGVLDGSLSLVSPAGGGTRLRAEIPV